MENLTNPSVKRAKRSATLEGGITNLMYAIKNVWTIYIANPGQFSPWRDTQKTWTRSCSDKGD